MSPGAQSAGHRSVPSVWQDPCTFDQTYHGAGQPDPSFSHSPAKYQIQK